MRVRGSGLVAILLLLGMTPTPARAQHAGHEPHVQPPDTVRKVPSRRGAREPRVQPRGPRLGTPAGPHGVLGHDQPAGGHSGAMPALYGPYDGSREASGTSWQPDAAEHHAVHSTRGHWVAMLHGFANVTGDVQGGERGDTQIIGTNMIMAVATRRAGVGRLGLRIMLSAEPWTVGREGYPLLLQTGESADGITGLIDRQHPHDLFMELAASYSVSDATRSVFVYAGSPGEPALGPPVFMHRRSGEGFPDSPIGHHWLDATHITYGVATLGAVLDTWKLEGSLFTGREPDHRRIDFERPRFDSRSVRLSANPTASWSFQASVGSLESPEALHPGVDTERITASALHAGRWRGGAWQTTLAWGRNRNRPGRMLDAVLVESALERKPLTWLARVERVEKDELFDEGDPLADRTFTVGRLTGGFFHDAAGPGPVVGGIGGTLGVALLPDALTAAYGDLPLSVMLVVRIRTR